VKRVGLTGGIGSGKTTIAKIFEAMAFPVFYSDEHAKWLMNDRDVQLHINSLLKADVFPNGKLDRAEMAKLIFSDTSKREAVNAYLHPKVRTAFNEWADNQQAAIVFNEAAILFETGAYNSMDLNVLVVAPLELRIERTMKRDHVSREAVLERISKQLPDEEKIPLADFVLVNDEKQPVLVQVEQIVAKISANY
jgi:dephospho-CoA kinase